jgi:nitrous oxidase accessory protein NosD
MSDGLPSPQNLGIAVTGGSDFEITDNVVDGYHRVGILAVGGDTNVDILGNEVVGAGPQNETWGENGIQLSPGVTGTVRRNEVSKHWYDADTAQSSGILLFGTESVTVERNEVEDNDSGISLFGPLFGAQVAVDSTIVNNTVEVTEADPGENGVFHRGIFVEGEDTMISQNEFKAVDGDIGVEIAAASENTKLIRNQIEGWDKLIHDEGDETKLPNPFDPDQ